MKSFFKILGIIVSVIAALGTIFVIVDRFYQKKKEKEFTRSLDTNDSAPVDDIEKIILNCKSEDCNCESNSCISE